VSDKDLDQAPQNVIQITIEDEMKRSYLDYAMSVIVSRAIPDVRDGLKPVHRRILYVMHESGYHASKPHRKSARIVGDVIGKYHPHGEKAVYDSLVRMAQEFSLRVPLVDGQGNFGSLDGDPPAAQRYTEARLEKVAHKLLEDIEKNTVMFQPNYDASEEEPLVLPASFPNLLVNGSGGIAVGMATNIPPHNLGEVIDACCAYIDNPEITIPDLMEIIPGPDFPTGASILGRTGINSAYHTGRGSIVMRGKAHIESLQNNKQQIVITEIPYMVNKAKLVEKIAELVNEKRIEGITDLRDESNKIGIRVVVELRRDVIAEVVLNQLYAYTVLQSNFGVIMLALDGGVPKVMNLKEVIAAFARFREEVITKRTVFLLNKAKDRGHILLGLLIAVNNIDPIIQMIKSARDPNEARERLISTQWKSHEVKHFINLLQDDYNAAEDESHVMLTEAQAKAILEMRLQRLTGMEKDKIISDLNELVTEINGYLEILNSREILLGIVKDEMLAVKKDFATPRITTIEMSEYEHDIEDLIPREDMVVTVTLSGYIKRVPLATYRAQKRGGKGRSGITMNDEDVITQIFVGVTHTPMLFFSNHGQVYSLKLYKLPLGTPQSKGRPMVNLLPLKEGEVITNIMPLPEDQNDWDSLNIMFATSKGNVRRNDLSDFKKIQSNGKIAIRLDEGDSLVNVKVCNENDHILLATRDGKAIRFSVDAVRVFKSRTSDGVRGAKLAGDDAVISMTVLRGIKCDITEREAYLSIPTEDRMKLVENMDKAHDFPLPDNLSRLKFLEMLSSEQFILSVSENGYGKRTSAYEYRITDRGGSGVVNMNLSDKTGRVVASIPVNNTDELMLITNSGKLIRCKLDSVRTTGRSTAGVILFKTEQDEKVVSVAIISEDDSESDDSEIESAE
jgi:DNA gyrase subunit A